MDARRESEPAPMKNRTTVERTSEREIVVTRVFNAPARIVFEAWTTPELFKQWWVPKSMGMSLLSCEMDARTGGKYVLPTCQPGVRQSPPGNYCGSGGDWDQLEDAENQPRKPRQREGRRGDLAASEAACWRSHKSAQI
jgi:hypothetical protein